LRLTRSIGVRSEPRDDAGYLGTVARDTRVGFRSARTGPGCELRWIEIEPNGWVCESYLEPSPKPPAGVELPKLERGGIVPGRFGKIVVADASTYRLTDAGMIRGRALEGSVTVREQGTREVDGKRFWHIGGGEWVLESAVREHEAPRHVGTRLGDETGLTLPLVFSLTPDNPMSRVATFTSPAETTRAEPALARTAFHLFETHADASGKPTHYRIGESRWIRAKEARVAESSAPPPHTLDGERWIDVDLDRQVLVAYEGALPVYATLVSTGRRAHPTETGLYRVWIKFAETTMNGQMADEPSYSMAQVPWTQFFAKDLALHTAYWHNHFGVRKSHGCVNLAPRDARFLYFWTDPQVPEGWSMAHGLVEAPGTLVRVRSAADPEPAFRGYAAKVEELRANEGS